MNAEPASTLTRRAFNHGDTMRFALALLALTTPALAGPKLPDQECSQQFVQQWRDDKDTAITMLPARACTMRTETGLYVCYKDGCVRESVYLGNN